METEIVAWYQSDGFYTALSGALLLIFSWIQRSVPTSKPTKVVLFIVIAILEKISKGIKKAVEIVPDNVNPAPEQSNLATKPSEENPPEEPVKKKWWQLRKRK